MKKLPTPKLPNKPSALIRLAVEDLKKTEKLKSYKINMSSIHDPEDGKCSVCFSGAIMAQTVKDPNLDLNWDAWTPQITAKFEALDQFRQGSIEDGLYCMGIAHPRFLAIDAAVTPYRADPKAFKKDMLDLANVLELHKL